MGNYNREDVKCCFCGEEEKDVFKNVIDSTKYEKDENEGKHICWSCAGYNKQDYFQCDQCGDFYKLASYGGTNNEAKGICRDCFKGR